MGSNFFFLFFFSFFLPRDGVHGQQRTQAVEIFRQRQSGQGPETSSAITSITHASPVFPMRSRPILMRMALTLQISKLKFLRFVSNVISYFWMFRVLPPVWQIETVAPATLMGGYAAACFTTAEMMSKILCISSSIPPATTRVSAGRAGGSAAPSEPQLRTTGECTGVVILDVNHLNSILFTSLIHLLKYFLHRQTFNVCFSKFSLFESQSGQPFKKCSTPRFFKCILSEVNVHCRNFRNESVSMLKHSKMNKKRNTKCPSRRPKLQLALPTFF